MQIDVACRMSRAALDWTQARLAREARVAVQVILHFEDGSSTPRRNNLREKIVLASEAAGVEFLVHGGRVVVLPPLPVPAAIAPD
jgi:DNA-binding XRE family transcriptional regulator